MEQGPLLAFVRPQAQYLGSANNNNAMQCFRLKRSESPIECHLDAPIFLWMPRVGSLSAPAARLACRAPRNQEHG